ncbi:MAG: extracellular solute-binding protein [Oscillospiraceae bacterium]|nr:extracellular solute-binding protein [Oscillospiraceae bacterium]
MKKLIALLLAVVMVATLFVGCKQEEKPAEGETTTLTFWQAGGDTVGAASVMRLLLDKFELQNPGIKVEYQAIPWSQDPHTQFQTAIAAGECADVLVLGSPLDFQLAGEGNLLALDELLTDAVKNDLSETLKANCIYNGNENPDMKGKMMSLPLYGGTRAMLYNKEIFDFFGVPYPTAGMNHAAVLEMAKKLTGDMNGKKVYGLGTRATTSEQYLNFVWNYGAQIINPETMTPGTDSEAWKKGIQDYMAFYEAGTTPEGAASMGGSDLLAMFVNGEVAMFMAAVDYAQAIIAEPVEEGQIAWADKLGVAPLFGETYATCYTGADVLAVPATTKNKDAAAKLLNYLMGTEVQATYCKNVGFFPGAKSAAQDSFFKDDPIQAGFAATMAGCHYFDNYGVPGVGTILKEEIQKLIAGECTIEEYQAAITSRINEKIAEMNA